MHIKNERLIREAIRLILREEAGPGKITELVEELKEINAQISESEIFRGREPDQMPKFGIGLSVIEDGAVLGFAAWNLERQGDFLWSSSLKAKNIKDALGGIKVPHGKIQFGRAHRGDRAHCLGAWSISITSPTSSGWGPLLYDLAIEVSTERGGGLTPDRDTVSKDARAVWSIYNSARRSDVTQAQLDISAEDIEWAARKQLGDLKHLTPDNKDDDCSQKSALTLGSRGEDRIAWHDSPLSRAYSKPPGTLETLRSLGLLRED